MLEELIEGELILEFYIDDNGRLAAIYLIAEAYIEGEGGEIVFIADFGDSITDAWHFELFVVDGNDILDIFEIVWEYEVDGPAHINVISFELEDDFAELASVWYADNGDFTLIVTYWDWWMADYVTNFIEGVFNTDNAGGFTLEFSDLERLTGLDLSIVISASQTTNITPPDSFISMSEWDEDLIERVLETVEALMFFLS